MLPFSNTTFRELFSDLPRALVRYYRRHGYIPNILRPRTLNEHVVHKQLFDRNPLLTHLADKYAVREYVAARIGSEYLKELYLVTEDPAAIDWDALPDSFVIKATHGCRYNLFVRDRNALDVTAAVARCRTWLGENFYWRGREWCYKHIPPRIIIEEFLSKGDHKTIPNEYEFYCFGGAPIFIQIHVDRFGDHRSNFYDSAWNRLPVMSNLANLDKEITPPPCLEEMLRVARALAAGLDFVRVDLYAIKQRIVFGEMTNYPANGGLTFVPAEYDRIIGEHWPK